MNKPLSISNTPATIQKDRLNILSVSEIINLFNMKSPRQKSTTKRQRSSSATKSMASPRTISLTQAKLSTCFETIAKVTSVNLQNKPQKDKQRLNSKTRILKSQHKQDLALSSFMTINLAGTTKKMKDSPHKRDQFRKKTVSRLMKQMGQLQATKKPKVDPPKIPALKIKQVHKFNRPKPLSDRLSHDTPQDIHHKRLNTTRSTKSIKAESRQSNNSLKPPDSDLFFRKESASTMSLKSKHLQSIQYLDDDQQLFSKEPSKPLEKPAIKAEALTALEQVKAKIYNQIDSLDKKLLTEKIRSQSSRHLKISLKKRIPVQGTANEEEEKS